METEEPLSARRWGPGGQAAACPGGGPPGAGERRPPRSVPPCRGGGLRSGVVLPLGKRQGCCGPLGLQGHQVGRPPLSKTQFLGTLGRRRGTGKPRSSVGSRGAARPGAWLLHPGPPVCPVGQQSAASAVRQCRCSPPPPSCRLTENMRRLSEYPARGRGWGWPAGALHSHIAALHWASPTCFLRPWEVCPRPTLSLCPSRCGSPREQWCLHRELPAPQSPPPACGHRGGVGAREPACLLCPGGFPLGWCSRPDLTTVRLSCPQSVAPGLSPAL